MGWVEDARGGICDVDDLDDTTLACIRLFTLGCVFSISDMMIRPCWYWQDQLRILEDELSRRKPIEKSRCIDYAQGFCTASVDGYCVGGWGNPDDPECHG